MLYEVVVDAVDPEATARWWAGILGATYGRDAEHGWSWVEDVPGAPFDSVVFVGVPEPKTVKNRVHLDLTSPDLQPLLDAGATLLRPRGDGRAWDVLADPEGNELCVFSPGRSTRR